MIRFNNENISSSSYIFDSYSIDAMLTVNRQNRYIPLLKAFTDSDNVNYNRPRYGKGSEYYNYSYLSDLFINGRHDSGTASILMKNHLVVGRGFLGVLLMDVVIPLVIVVVKGTKKRSLLKPSDARVYVSKEFYDNKKDYRSEKVWVNKLIKWCEEKDVRVIIKNNIHDNLFLSVRVPPFNTIKEMRDYCDDIAGQFRQNMKHEREKK